MMTQSGRGSVRTDEDRLAFNSVKVFSATMAQDRGHLGEKVTAWLIEHPRSKVVDTIVTQSSDAAFHCLAITIFYQDEIG